MAARGRAPLDQRFRDVVRERLRDAMHARDRTGIGVLRAIIAGIDNAGAPPGHRGGDGDGEPAPAIGLGAAETARLDLGPEDLRDVLSGLRAEYESMAHHMDAAGRVDDAARERRSIEVVDEVAQVLSRLVEQPSG